MREIWKPIPGFHGRYKASSKGRIRSLGRSIRFVSKAGKECYRISRDKILKTDRKINNSGYHTCYLGEDAPMFVHVAVCLAFHGAKPSRLSVVNHKDFNRKNNESRNLEWVTYKENMRHSMAAGRFDNCFRKASQRWSGKKNPKARKDSRFHM